MTMQLTIGGNTKRSKLGTFDVELPDFDVLPEKTRDFVIAYGLKQYLADGMAGAADRDAAQEGIDKRTAKLLEGDFTRTRGDGAGKVDSVDQRALKLIRQMIRDKAKAQSVKLDKEQVDETAQTYLDSPKGQQYRDIAQRQLDEERAIQNEPDEDEGDDILGNLFSSVAGASEDEDEED
jgi:hypothetical protein